MRIQCARIKITYIGFKTYYTSNIINTASIFSCSSGFENVQYKVFIKCS